MIDIYTDGATKGHNGKLGTVTEVGIGIYIPAFGEGVGRKTNGISNNEAEFKALIAGMRLAQALNIKQARFKLDSQIVVNRANGARPKKAKFKNERMYAFQDTVFELKKNFTKVEFQWIPREENDMADMYSKECLL